MHIEHFAFFVRYFQDKLCSPNHHRTLCNERDTNANKAKDEKNKTIAFACE